MNLENFLTVTQAAQRLKKTGARVRQLIADGQLEAAKVHERLWVISLEEFERFRKVERPEGIHRAKRNGKTQRKSRKA